MRARMEQEDREYKMGLAAIREAGHQTQTELARKLGKPQANVSRTERAGDMLYSTLLAYLEAASATDVALVATVGGHRVEVALAST
jgi:transcriptional regulator with XRE-family HTH domain